MVVCIDTVKLIRVVTLTELFCCRTVQYWKREMERKKFIKMMSFSVYLSKKDTVRGEYFWFVCVYVALKIRTKKRVYLFIFLNK